MTYDVTGSGTGKARIMKEEGPEVQFAGSDSLLKESDYEAHPDLTLQMFPTMAGWVTNFLNCLGRTVKSGAALSDSVYCRRRCPWCYCLLRESLRSMSKTCAGRVVGDRVFLWTKPPSLGRSTTAWSVLGAAFLLSLQSCSAWVQAAWDRHTELDPWSRGWYLQWHLHHVGRLFHPGEKESQWRTPDSVFRPRGWKRMSSSQREYMLLQL